MTEAYRGFDHPEVAPLRTLEPGLHVLELFHGPTLAFKDFALQLLGRLYDRQVRLTGEPITVLGATSGDTGAAAIHGLLGIPGVRIFILYPDGRVSPLQERQMACTGAGNVFPLAIAGSFDDAQAALKEVFGDPVFRAEVRLSAVNSINLARILAQTVYYLAAWFQLPREEREKVEFIVPTGNFGNVLAGWLLSRMGLAGCTFRVATNQNDILDRLFRTGIYQLGRVEPSYAPSMDIQVASNFERFVHFLYQRDSERLRQTMAHFASTGRVDFGDFDRMGISSSRTPDNEIPGLIRRVSDRYGYTVDPHTACGFQTRDPERTAVVLGTASPAKFPEVITEATGVHPSHPGLEALRSREVVSYPVEPTAAAIKEFIRSH